MSTSNLVRRCNKRPCRMILMNIGDRVRSKRTELELSQGDLGKRAGVSYQAIQQIEAGGGSKHVVAIAKALGVSAEWLQSGQGPVNHEARNHGTLAPDAAKFAPEGFLKVLGMAECGPDGWSLWNGDVVDHVPRPAYLAGAAQAYAVYAVGNSMEPRYFAGDLVYIHPGKPVTPGCFVLVQIVPKEDGTAPRAVLKRLVKRSGSKITLAQFDPAKTFDLKADEIVSIHRAVGSSEA